MGVRALGSTGVVTTAIVLILLLGPWPSLPGIGASHGSLLPATGHGPATGVVSAPPGTPAAVPSTAGATGPFLLSFAVVPSACGPIGFNGTAQANATTGNYSSGTYMVTANLCINYAFRQWNASGGILIPRGNTSSSTIVNVTGAGSLTAWYVWTGWGGKEAAVGFFVKPAACGPIQLGGLDRANGSSANYVAGNYTLSEPKCAGYNYPPTVTATGAIQLPKLGADPETVWVKGNGTLTATYSLQGPPPGPFTVGFLIDPASCGPLTFNGTSQANGTSVVVPGGDYPARASACPNHWFGSFSYQYGNHIIMLHNATPDVPVAENGTLVLEYIPYLQAGLAANRTSVGVGGSVILSPSVSGGWGTYACTWNLNGTNTTAAGSCGNLTPSFPAAGNYTYRLWAADATNHSAESAAVVIRVFASSPLGVGLAADTTNVSAGNPVVLTPSVTGGVGPYACTLSLNGTNITSGACAGWTEVLAHPGNYSYAVWVTDAEPRSLESAAVVVEVSTTANTPAPIVVLLVANATTIEAGRSVALNLSWSSGTCPCQVAAWSLNGTNDTSLGIGTPLTVSLPHPGNYTYIGWVSESNGRLGASPAVTIEVVRPVSSPSPPPPSGSSSPSFLDLNTSGELVFVLVAAGALAVVGGLLLWRRRRQLPPGIRTGPF